MKRSATLGDRIDQRIFDALYSRSLVYNTCWEDPAVDRAALALTGDDTVLAITCAGCNVLDYALTAWFAGRHGGFYFHGLAGIVARTFRAYLN